MLVSKKLIFNYFLNNSIIKYFIIELFIMSKHQFLYYIPDDISDTDYHHQDNIVNAAASIIKRLINNEEVVCCAEMQSGKTDVMKRLIYVINNYNEKIKSLGVDIDKFNIYLIVCASSINLKKQLIGKLPEIKQKIYHLNDVQALLKNKFENEDLFASMTNSGLIIFDECHCDAEQQKLMDKFRKILKKMSTLNKTSYVKVGFSATPYEQILAGYSKVIMKPNSGYYGMKQMFEAGFSKKNDELLIIFQAKNLADPYECQQLFEEIQIRNYYYIIRLPGNKNTEELVFYNIHQEFKHRGFKFDSFIYDMSYYSNINELLNEKPIKPTIIYLRDKLRMGEYLNTEFVYLVHDDPNNTHAHTTAQSLIGRCCGYNKKNHSTIIYCDYEKAYQHFQWIEHNYDVDYIPHDVKYIKKKLANSAIIVSIESFTRTH